MSAYKHSYFLHEFWILHYIHNLKEQVKCWPYLKYTILSQKSVYLCWN